MKIYYINIKFRVIIDYVNIYISSYINHVAEIFFDCYNLLTVI